jgi:hypothetical protein
MYYDGTDGIINPKEVGSGQLKVLGKTNITGNLTAYEITPATTNTYSLGSTTLRWLKGWFSELDVSGNINQTNGTAYLNNLTIQNQVGITGAYNCTSFPNVTIVSGVITSWSC